MAQFNKEKLDMFLGIVRKYMQVRGSLSQKDLAELTEIGVSTMSRFLNQQTKELNSQLIAKIAAKLEIPLHEIIDFVDEEYGDHFIRLVKFYKGEQVESPSVQGLKEKKIEHSSGNVAEQIFNGTRGTAQKDVKGRIKIGNKSHTVSYNRRDDDRGSITDQIKGLTARQRGFLVDFLNLDTDGRDLVVDIGKNIIGYLRQKGIDF